MMSRNRSCGTCFPITTRQTVSGVANSNPIGPHSHVQNTADARIATVEIPVLAPYSSGSITLTVKSSIVANNPTVHTNTLQPGYTASEISSGNDAAIHGPTYG